MKSCGSSMTRLKYDAAQVAQRFGVPVPPLPVTGKRERALYSRLSASCGADFQKMACEWATQVDAITVFPKLPVQLRLYHKIWMQNSKVKAAIVDHAHGLAITSEILKETEASLPNPVMPPPMVATRARRAAPDVLITGPATHTHAVQVLVTPIVHANLTDVGGISMRTDTSAPPAVRPPIQKKRHGDRGTDVKERSIKKCYVCKSDKCPGRGDRKLCTSQC